MSEITLQKNIGEITTETKKGKTSVKWKIPNFFSLQPYVDCRFESPVFIYLDGLWCLQVNPTGEYRYDSIGYVGMYLKKVFSDTPEHTVAWEMGILNEDGSMYTSTDIETSFVGNERSWGKSKMAQRNVLFTALNITSLHYYVTFFFKLRGTDKENVRAISHKIQLEDNHLEKPDSPLMLLSRSFKNLLLSQKRSDVVLKVKDREFPAHKVVLEARSSVFAKMFEHDMLENRNGIVDIPDFEPEIFQHVLNYIYSGEIEGFSPENICQMYKAADMYDLEKLKEKCSEYIESNVTVENVCDVLLLSDLHQETKIKLLVQDFIALNKQKILKSESWKILVLENQSLAYQTLESTMLHYTK